MYRIACRTARNSSSCRPAIPNLIPFTSGVDNARPRFMLSDSARHHARVFGPPGAQALAKET
ncbi:MAG TPA: hypothetical protein VK509_08610, partial [Polyangiales bacterium]|nr:hypothetical protein [Polyangiales bacterium]